MGTLWASMRVATVAPLLLLVACCCGGGTATPDPHADEFGGGLLPDGELGPNAASIEAARQLGMSSERTPLLVEIAERDDLTENDQLFLINVGCDGGMSDDKAAVLEALARNPVLTRDAELHLATELDCIMFSDDRERVAQALADRAGGAPPDGGGE